MKDEPPLALEARCRDAGCNLEGDDLFIEITITSRASSLVALPLAYLQKTGPVIRLIDRRGGGETFLRTNLADPAESQRATLRPGDAALLAWVLHREELGQFGAPIDVVAEITIATVILLDGKERSFQGTTTLPIRIP